MKNFALTLGILLWISLNTIMVQGSDIYAGYISAKHVSGFEYEITLTTYTNVNQTTNKRCAADFVLYYESNFLTNLTNVPRVNGPDMVWNPASCPLANPKAGEKISDAIRKNEYTINYTFPGAGEAQIIYQSFSREVNIMNITRPDLTNFSVEAIFNITATGNSTPELDGNLLVDATSGTALSLASLVKDGGENDTQVYTLQKASLTTGYKFPSDAAFGGGSFTVDANTGAIDWTTPTMPGFYLASIKIEEMRGATMIGFNTIDFVITVDVTAGIDLLTTTPIEIGPNPVSNQLTVGMDLTQPSVVQTQLLDLTGRQVQNFATEEATQGTYQKNWNLNPSIGNGIYFLRIRVNGEELTKKVVVRR